MSGERFLIGLRELEYSEHMLSMSSLIKEGIDFQKEDIQPSDNQSEPIYWLNAKLDEVRKDIDSCMLNTDAIQVWAARKVIVDLSKCVDCKDIALGTSVGEMGISTLESFLEEDF